MSFDLEKLRKYGVYLDICKNIYRMILVLLEKSNFCLPHLKSLASFFEKDLNIKKI